MSLGGSYPRVDGGGGGGGGGVSCRKWLKLTAEVSVGYMVVEIINIINMLVFMNHINFHWFPSTITASRTE